MKKNLWIIILLVALLSISLAGCNSAKEPKQITKSISVTPIESSSHDDVTLQEKRNAILAGLIRYEADVQATITQSPPNTYNLGVIIRGADYITDFGEIVIITKSIFEREFPDERRGGIIVSLQDDNNTNLVSFQNEGVDNSNYGSFMDLRSGTLQCFQLEDESDLVAKFPAARQYIAKSHLDAKSVEIYDEVWATLDAQYNRPEEEIFEELAPRYDMTAEELKSLIRDMMSQIYQ